MVVKGRWLRETVERMDDECVIGCYINGRRPKTSKGMFSISTRVTTSGQHARPGAIDTNDTPFIEAIWIGIVNVC
jgi:hypothetical protein